MKALDHPHVLKLHEVFEDERFVYLVVELCTGGEVLDRILELGYFTERLAARLMAHLLEAINHVHERGIAHRDLKLENCLLSGRLEDADLKLADFGLANHCSVMHTAVGSVAYAAPEVLSGSYTEACDLWSCGVILYILLSGRQPFYGKNNKEIMKQAKSGRFSMEAAQWQEISPDAQDLIRHLLVLDPSQRLTAAQALEHEWIAKGAPQASWSLFGLDGLNIMENLRRFSAHSRLKRSALQVIATQMTDEKIQDLQKAFEAIDKNDDGKVTVEELCDALQRRGAELPKDARETLSKMDIMEKGHISYPEFLASALDARDCLCEEACWTAFKAFDENDDGHISASELLTILEHQALQELPQSPSPKKMISEVDVNGTGQIEFDEFMRMIISERENPSRVETD